MNKRIAKRKKQKRKKFDKAFFIARNGMMVKSMPFFFFVKKGARFLLRPCLTLNDLNMSLQR